MIHHRRASALAWSLFAIWAVIAVATAWFGLRQPDNADSIFPVLMVGYIVVGALVAARHPANAIGWLLLAIALTLAFGNGAETYAISHSPGDVAAAWVSQWTFHVWFFLTVAFLPLVFPTGRVLSPRWKVVWWFDLLCLVAGVLVIGLKPARFNHPPVENPLAVHGTAQTVIEAVSRLWLPTYTLAVVLTGVSLVLRFRRSAGVERQQLKWFATAVFMAVGGLTLSAIADATSAQIVNDIGWIIFLFTFVLGIPIATGIAILRHRLYDIDVVINRTLVYSLLTAALAGTYAGSVLLLRLLLGPITGRSDLAVAASTLAVAAVFRPARARIQALVDRRFYRRRYDAARTLDDFASQLRHELDLDAIGTDLRAAVSETMQPMTVSLWLRGPHR